MLTTALARCCSIKRIRMVNFMTHRDVTFNPTAGTNFVVGANGSGKSSLVCAICLCLGGGAANMERAKDIKSFIRSGSSESTISVVLHGKPEHGDLEITRRLSTASSGDKWFLNGAQVGACHATPRGLAP